MAFLPALVEVQSSPSSSQSPLAIALGLLFEHSPILVDTLEPQVHAVLESSPLESYAQLIDIALKEIGEWDMVAQSAFISGHPRIGESENLSKLSASEQSGKSVQPTPPDVLARLAYLNTLYELKYPGLRYITFVNGRSRAAVMKEMEDALGIAHSLLPPNELEPDTVTSVNVASKEWQEELNRAVYDIGRIAKSRLRALGVD